MIGDRSQPLKKKGIKTAESARLIFEKYTALHIETGISVFKNMQAKEKAGFGYQF
jgi:hypothetical protein